MIPRHLGAGTSRHFIASSYLDFSTARRPRPDLRARPFSAAESLAGILPLAGTFPASHRAEYLAELDCLRAENHPELFVEALISLGQRWERMGLLEAAGSAYETSARVQRDHVDSPAFASRIESRLEALRGQGAELPRLEFLGRNLARQATDPAALFAMGCAGMAFRATRLLALSRFTGAWAASPIRYLGARFLTNAIAFTAETVTFTAGSRVGNALLLRPQDWSSETLGREYLGGALTLLGLKTMGGLAHAATRRWATGGTLAHGLARGVLPQAALFAGIYGSHELEISLGLRPHVDNATGVIDAMAILLQFHAAGRLTQTAFGPHWEAAEREFAYRGQALADTGRTVESFSDAPSRKRVSGGEISLANGLTIGLSLSMGLEPVNEYEIERIYRAADIRRYQKHGLDFEYALVTRRKFPYLLEIGSAGYRYGDFRFVMKDFVLSLNTPSEIHKTWELIAVHEYGESIFNDHHQATLLEFEVARRDGFLERYLEIQKEHWFLKFRDVALNHMDLGRTSDPDVAAESESGMIGDSPASLAAAVRLRDAFRWPDGIQERFRVENEAEERTREDREEDWDQVITVNEQARSYFQLASRGLRNFLGRPPEGAGNLGHWLEQGFREYYRRLAPLSREFGEGHLDPQFLQAERMEDLVDGMLQGWRNELPETSELGNHEFWRRNVSDHLTIASGAREWLQRIEGPAEGSNRRSWEKRFDNLVTRIRSFPEGWSELDAMEILNARGLRDRHPELEEVFTSNLIFQMLSGRSSWSRDPRLRNLLFDFLRYGRFPDFAVASDVRQAFFAKLADLSAFQDNRGTFREETWIRALLRDWGRRYPLPPSSSASPHEIARTSDFLQAYRALEARRFLSGEPPLWESHGLGEFRNLFEQGVLPEWRGRETYERFFRPLLNEGMSVHSIQNALPNVMTSAWGWPEISRGDRGSHVLHDLIHMVRQGLIYSDAKQFFPDPEMRGWLDRMARDGEFPSFSADNGLLRRFPDALLSFCSRFRTGPGPRPPEYVIQSAYRHWLRTFSGLRSRSGNREDVEWTFPSRRNSSDILLMVETRTSEIWNQTDFEPWIANFTPSDRIEMIDIALRLTHRNLEGALRFFQHLAPYLPEEHLRRLYPKIRIHLEQENPFSRREAWRLVAVLHAHLSEEQQEEVSRRFREGDFPIALQNGQRWDFKFLHAMLPLMTAEQITRTARACFDGILAPNSGAFREAPWLRRELHELTDSFLKHLPAPEAQRFLERVQSRYEDGTLAESLEAAEILLKHGRIPEKTVEEISERIISRLEEGREGIGKGEGINILATLGRISLGFSPDFRERCFQVGVSWLSSKGMERREAAARFVFRPEIFGTPDYRTEQLSRLQRMLSSRQAHTRRIGLMALETFFSPSRLPSS